MDDLRGTLKQADTLLEHDDIAGAVALYTSVAHFYATQGFALKAVAIWKQILAIAAQQRDQALDKSVRAQLITLYRSLGLETDARALEDAS